MFDQMQLDQTQAASKHHTENKRFSAKGAIRVTIPNDALESAFGAVP